MPVQRDSRWIFWPVEWSDEEEKPSDMEQKSTAFQSQDKAKNPLECSWGKTELAPVTFSVFIATNTSFVIPPPLKNKAT